LATSVDYIFIMWHFRPTVVQVLIKKCIFVFHFIIFSFYTIAPLT